MDIKYYISLLTSDIDISSLKTRLLIVIGSIGTIISNAFGGWSHSLNTLLIFIVIDFITGLIVAISPKETPKGQLNSKIGFIGLLKKGLILLVVLIGYRLDLIIGTSYIKDMVTIAYIVNELISVIENFGLLGMPMPTAITSAIEVLKNKEGKK